MAKDFKLSPQVRWAIVGAAALVYTGACWGEYQIDNLAKTNPARIQEEYKNVRLVSADKIDPANENKVVLVQGKLTGTKALDDPDFGVKINGILLSRVTQIYGDIDNGKRQISVWISEDANQKKKFESKQFWATPLNLGAFEIGTNLVWLEDSIVKTIKIKLPPPPASLPANKIAPLRSDGEGNYWTAKDGEPLEGDERIRFEYEVLRDTDVTVIGKQHGKTLHPYDDSDDFHIAAGKLSLADFARRDEDFGKGLYLVLRVPCFFLLSIAAGVMMLAIPMKASMLMRIVVGVLIAAVPFVIDFMVLGK